MSDWRTVQALEAEVAELRSMLCQQERKQCEAKLADDLNMVAAREAREQAEQQTERLRLRETCRRGCILDAEIASHANDMIADQVFNPQRLEAAVNVLAADLNFWPGGEQQMKDHEFLWQHLPPSGDRHSSLGDDGAGPLERKLAGLLNG
jgi:hypothetical protein